MLRKAAALSAIVVSIIVPTGGDIFRLGWTLAGLAQQTGIAPGNVELIVVGDGLGAEKDVEVKQLLTDWREHLPASVVRYEALPVGEREYRPAEARNRGIALAQGERCVFLDEDCVPGKFWLMAHQSATGAVYGFRRRLATRMVQTFSEAVPGGSFPPLDIDAFIDGYDIRTQQPQAVYSSWFACNASAPTAILRELGGFDADSDGSDGTCSVNIVYTDVDLAARMKRHGVAFDRLDAWVTHLDHPRREGLLSGDKYYANIFAQEDRIVLESGAIAEDIGAGEEIVLPELKALDTEAVETIAGPAGEEQTHVNDINQ